MTDRLIIVDKDAKYAEWLRNHLGVFYSDANVRVMSPEQFDVARETLTYDECDLVLLTASFGEHPEDPRAEGISLLRSFRARTNFPAVLALAEDGNELTAVRALQLGAVDYLPKRLLTPERLGTAVRLALRRIERRVARRQAKIAQSGEHAAVEAQEQAAPTEAEAAESEGASAEAADEVPADLVPGYTIRSLIGESEKARVYLAVSDALGREIALKVSSIETDEAGGRHLLAREYEAVSGIRHPAVVELHDYGVHAGREFLAMEYFPQGDLRSRMRQALDPGIALYFLRQIAAGLEAIHQAGIAHRDLKPDNVMMRQDGMIAIADFGVAKQVSMHITDTGAGDVVGTPYYLSPEQALGKPVDARCDIYSLGVLAYEMLTGTKPYLADTARALLLMHANAPLPVLPPAHQRFQPVLDKMMAKDPEQRYASAADLLDALARLGQ